MTGEPAHTASKERRVPELMFSSEYVPQLSITDSKSEVAITLHLFSAHHTALQTKHSIRSTSTTTPVPTENTDDSHLQMRSHASCYHESTP